MADDIERRIRELERGHERQSGKLDIMEVKITSIVTWTERKDARSEWLMRAVVGAVVVAIIAWTLILLVARYR